MTLASHKSEIRTSIWVVRPYIRVIQTLPEAADILSAFTELLGREGMAPATCLDPQASIPSRLVKELIELAIDRSGDSAIGLRAAECFGATDLELVERALEGCSNLREAIHRHAGHMRVLNGGAVQLLEGDGDQAIIRYELPACVSHPARVDYWLAFSQKFIRLYMDIKAAPFEIHVMHAKPSHAEVYPRFLWADVKFDMPHNAFIFPRRQLDLPLRPMGRAQCDLERSVGVPSFQERTRQVVLAALSGGDVNMQGVSQALEMSMATLRRRLAEEGTSFSQVLNEVRRTLAEHQLRDSLLEIADIAAAIGFADVAAFHKAFKRWNKMTPGEYRTLRGAKQLGTSRGMESPCLRMQRATVDSESKTCVPRAPGCGALTESILGQVHV